MIKEKLQDIGILMTGRELPSIIFLLSEQNVNDLPARHSWGQDPLAKLPLAVEDALTKYLRDKGFVVVNPGTVLLDSPDMASDVPPSLIERQDAMLLAEQTGADVVITGKATARFSGNVLGTDMKSVEANLLVDAVRVDTEMDIGSFQATGAAVHANEMVAGTEAITIAASNLVEELAREIAANWGRETRQTVLAELVVQGIREYVDFVKFRRILKSEIRGIKNVYLRGIKAGEAKMDVDLQGDTRALADELMLKSFEGFGINIFEVSQKAIKLEFIPKTGIQGQPSIPQEPSLR
jgi:hypothetical protein